MASSHHTEVTVQPTYPPPVQYPGTYVVVDQSQQHGASSAKKYNSNYSRVSSILFGFLQIFLCIVTIGGAIMVEMKEANGHELGTGFWCGIIYAAAGCLAVAAGWHAPKSMIIAVAVFSFLDIPFGITAIVLSIDGITDSVDCNYERCWIENFVGTSGNFMICTTGIWEIIFGLCLLIISVRAICIGSKTQVSSVPVYYASSAPETVQLNQTTSLHAHVTYPPTLNGALQTPQKTAEENQYETLDQNKF